MKKLILLIWLLFYFSIVFTQNQNVKFNTSDLTEQEVNDCENFKNKKGQERYDEFEKIKHIFPQSEFSIDSTETELTFKEGTVNFIMTKSQLYQLIGKPDFKDGAYEVGSKKHDCEIYFSINDRNEVLGFFSVNCSKYIKEQ